MNYWYNLFLNFYVFLGPCSDPDPDPNGEKLVPGSVSAQIRIRVYRPKARNKSINHDLEGGLMVEALL